MIYTKPGVKMEMNEIIALISLISKGAKEAKALYSNISLPIFLPKARNSLNSLEEKINFIEGQVLILEEKCHLSFPKLSQLIRSYSDLIANVRIASALSDKAAEIYGIAPDEAPIFKTMFANDRQQDYSRVTSGMTNLPTMDVEEKGKIEAKLDNIRDNIRDLKNSNQNDIEAVKRIFDNISTQYSDIESILGGLLNKILMEMELSVSQ